MEQQLRAVADNERGNIQQRELPAQEGQARKHTINSRNRQCLHKTILSRLATSWASATLSRCVTSTPFSAAVHKRLFKNNLLLSSSGESSQQLASTLKKLFMCVTFGVLSFDRHAELSRTQRMDILVQDDRPARRRRGVVVSLIHADANSVLRPGSILSTWPSRSPHPPKVKPLDTPTSRSLDIGSSGVMSPEVREHPQSGSNSNNSTTPSLPSKRSRARSASLSCCWSFGNVYAATIRRTPETVALGLPTTTATRWR
mgnify:CR=1 FL=1